ncbi:MULTISPECIES: carbonic anhydrase [Emticicia]|uniref:carbonic anhydrase n=1 Tax=Emticicia TaxID=312278 RepID=UPI00209F1E8A|nr:MULTISPECIES: carbonic anhydrase [Emticicia]UTA69839.1 carbonic anhydrase [Emticicia sp. 21SJ11W-3]
MESYQKLLLANKAWASEKLQLDPTYFKNLAADQKPEFLWIGCSDSRVPADQVSGTQPGEIFVHRNVANLVIHTDMSMLSVLQYAVEVLKVKHILVVGHYQCGGVKASMTNNDYGLINNWLRNIKDVYTKYQDELQSIDDDQERFDRLVEVNVIEQVKNVAKTTIVQNAWSNSEYPMIHGWVVDLKTGLIKPIIEIESKDHDALEDVYNFDFNKKKKKAIEEVDV